MSSSTRGRAGKYKAKRGGGRQFSKNLRPLDADGAERSMWAEPVAEDSDSDDDSEEDSEEESSDEDGAPQPQAEMTREQRKAAARARKEAAIKKKTGGPAAPGDLPSNSDDSSDDDDDDDMPANPNHSASARKQAAKPVAAPAAAADDAEKKRPRKVEDVSQLSRREREAYQAEQARLRYQKLHAEGKTDEARADLERLKLVRQQREEAAARKESEKQERELLDVEKKAQMERLERQAALKAARGGRGAKKGGKS